MQNFLAGYHLSDPTWLYLSFVLILAVYFKFSRLWSLRNLDLLLLLGISPGVLMLRSSEDWLQRTGMVWLFVALGLSQVRVLLDGLFVRRPRLEQNMNVAGMSFLCAATVIFLTTKLLSEPLHHETARALTGSNSGNTSITVPDAPPFVVDSAATGDGRERLETGSASGPTTALVKRAVDQISRAVVSKGEQSDARMGKVETLIVRGIAVLSHLAVIIGLTLIGRRLFGDPDLGFAMSSLYILMPCTAYDLGSVIQVLPAALVVWALYLYRIPIASGSLLGLAAGVAFFPAFLLPLWVSFYGKRGSIRFAGSVLMTAGIVVGALAFLSQGSSEFLESTVGYVRWTSLNIWEEPNGESFWSAVGPAFRLPVLVTYLLMLIGVTIWPRQKSLAQLIPQSAAVVLGVQFWYPDRGGVYVLWYLPLLLLVVFRPMMSNHFAPEIQPWVLFGSRRMNRFVGETETTRV